MYLIVRSSGGRITLMRQTVAQLSGLLGKAYEDPWLTLRETPALHPCFMGMIVRLTNPVLEGTGFGPRSSLDRACLRCSDL